MELAPEGISNTNGLHVLKKRDAVKCEVLYLEMASELSMEVAGRLGLPSWNSTNTWSHTSMDAILDL